MARKTIVSIKKQKSQQPLVALTAYSARMAELLDPHVDILLVGDSLGMVVYGLESTLAVNVDMMVAHGRAVVKGSRVACVVVDMPFGSYQGSKETAFDNAARIMAETGCNAVKLEGGVVMEDTIAYLTQRGIAVMAHVGLKPQSVHADGGYRFHGRNAEECAAILADAQAVERAGAFSVVIEGVTATLAQEITQKLAIPTIGIGASVACDGQVLVTDDMLGMFGGNVAKFVRQYDKFGERMSAAVENFSADVRTGNFPAAEECYELKSIYPSIEEAN